MEDSEKMLDVAEPTTEVAENTAEVAETQPQEEMEFTDNQENSNQEEKKETPVEESKEESKEQSPEERAEFAKIRRKAEEDAQKKIESETKKAYEKGKLEAYKGKINPYTNKPITDLADIEMYEVMFQLEQEGKDPINDLPEKLSSKRREEAKAIQEKKEAEEKTAREIEEFQTKYPNVDLSELLKDSFFNDYIQGKTKSLTELYDGFNNFKNAFRNSAVEVAKQTLANAQASPGSLGSETETIIDYNSMSQEDFKRHLEMVKNGEMK